MKYNKTPSQAQLREMFTYDAEDGNLRNRRTRHYRARKGEIAGCVYTPSCYKHHKTPCQYRIVWINGKLHKAHRLVLVYVYGDIPTDMQIDHIDGNGLNNRLDNLRLVTHQENGKNQRRNKNNTSGIVGVYFYRARGKWRAQIKINGKKKHLGYYDTKEQAARARQAADKRYAFHENHGLPQETRCLVVDAVRKA